MGLRDTIANWLIKSGTILSAGKPRPAMSDTPVAYQYPVSVNTRYTNPALANVSPEALRRRGVEAANAVAPPEALPPGALRALADACDMLRLAIETRKDQIGRFAWEIRPIEGRTATKKSLASVRKLLQRPDGINSWSDWLRTLLEDLLVIDAVAISVNYALDGTVLGFEPIDSATIKPLITDRGTTPTSGPAYQQIIHGTVYANLTRSQLAYRNRNRRTWRQYGHSPVAQVHQTVQHAILSAAAQVEYLTEGNVPHMLLRTPETWTARQIAEFQSYWETLGAGGKSRATFVPGGIDPIETRPTGGTIDAAANEWLARVICYALSVSPSALVRDNNRATAEQAADSAMSEGLAPLLAWIKTLIDDLIQFYMGLDGIEFVWSVEQTVRPLERAQIHATYLGSGVLTLDEVRTELGLEPLAFTVQPAAQAPPQPQEPQPQEPQPQPQALNP